MSVAVLQEIENLLTNLSREEKVQLVGRLAEQLRQEPPASLVCARGRWKDKFPPDFDLDSVLKEIRGEWRLEEGSRGE